MSASSSRSNSMFSASSLRSRARSACSVSDCELTDTYSPAAIDKARRRDDTVVRSEHCCSQPSDTLYQMAFGVRVKPAHGDLIIIIEDSGRTAARDAANALTGARNWHRLLY